MKQCEICGKGSIIRGSRKKLRGNYNPTGTSRRFPNLQKTITSNGRRVLSCTQCIKTSVKKSKKSK
ncbi:MAG: 50S ribosomal protein L28 [Patescibacteria group bacterium]|nr:50S ribosomal protein L28 [Patescibacteria group bacterium]